MHRENTSSQIYRGISASLGFKKPQGTRLFRGFKEICRHSGECEEEEEEEESDFKVVSLVSLKVDESGYRNPHFSRASIFAVKPGPTTTPRGAEKVFSVAHSHERVIAFKSNLERQEF